MKRTLAVTACAVLCAGQAAAFAPQDDDWEFQQDESRKLTVAAVRYDAGVAVIVQCREGALTAALVGLPVSTGPLVLEASRADGRGDSQAWTPAGAEGVYRSTVPARDVRFMRGGGAYSVHTAGGAATTFRTTFDLPAQSANLERVLAACGWAVTDERDLLARADVTFGEPNARPHRTSRPRPGARSARRETPPVPPVTAPLPAEDQISCIVRDLRLTGCRPDHAPREGQDLAAAARRMEGTEVHAVEGAAPPEGTVLYATHSTYTVIDYIATVPAR